MTMTPNDERIIEQLIADVTKDINALIALCDGRQRFSPGDGERARYEYESLKSKLQGLAVHVFESEEGRNFCHSSGLNIASPLSAKGGDSPEEIARCLRGALDEASYRLWKLSKASVSI